MGAASALAAGLITDASLASREAGTLSRRRITFDGAFGSAMVNRSFGPLSLLRVMFGFYELPCPQG